MKFLLFLLFLFPLYTEAQISGEMILQNDTDIVIENQQLHEFFDRQLKIIDTVDGNTWVCVPEKIHFKKHDRVILIENFPIAFEITNGDVKIKDTKVDFVEYDFKEQKKVKVKNGSLSHSYKYPKNAKEKIKDKLRKVK